jgi:nucleotide-binding universal stress UspA family protein
MSEPAAPAPGHGHPTSILLATDGSDDAALARRAAVDLARRTGARLHVVHAWDVPIVPYGYPGYVVSPADFEDAGRAILEEEVRAIEGSGLGAVDSHLAQGRPGIAILAVADEVGAGLLLIGSRGLGPVRRLVMGSVSEEVVHHAQRPVMIMRGGDAAWPPARVVVGDDGSPAASAAATMAAQVAHLFTIPMLVVEAVPRIEERDISAPGMSIDTALGSVKARLDERTAALAAPGLGLETRVMVEDAALAILDAADGTGAALIAVGTRGLGSIARMRLGSVSTKVLRGSHMPVLVAHAG